MIELAHRQVAHGLDVGHVNVHGFDASSDFLGSGVLVCSLNGLDQTFLYPSLYAFRDSPQGRVLTVAGVMKQSSNRFANRIEDSLNGVRLNLMDVRSREQRGARIP